MSIYAELHLHTAFSFLDGASLPEELVLQAAALGYTALAVTDHDGLHGAMEFARAAKAAGIQPIIGAELTLTDRTHLILLAESAAGYANLCQLITAAHQGPLHGMPTAKPDPKRPVGIDPALLAEHSAGLILLTGCRQGALSRLVDAEQFAEASTLLKQYVDWFGSANVAVELQHNRVFGDTRRVRLLAGLAARYGLPAVVTGNVHYHRPERHRLQDVMVAIRHRATLDATHRERRPNPNFALCSPAEMAERFHQYPAAVRASLAIAERCARFDLTQHLAYTFPAYPTAPGETADEVLAHACRAALQDRYPLPQHTVVLPRIDKELALIKRHRLAGFFLLYRDLLIMAREVAAGIRGPGAPSATLPPGRGRGSSVSSVVCYLIGLSHIDPLAHNLELGRFLNEELSSIPDIDIDFPREIREKLIERVYETYGPNHAAMVCAFPTYRLRSAVRDVGKALGLPASDLDRIAKLSEPRSATALGDELARMPAYASRLQSAPWKYLVELAGELAGFPRHVSQHSGGMIISSSPLVNLVPVQPAAMAGRFICQWDKDSCDDAGFVKIDFLALGMLSLVEECLPLIVEAGKEAVDLSRVDFDDERVYDMICAGDTIGTFQIESRAQIQTLLKTQPRNLQDLTVQVAIVRPGPIVGGAVSPFVQQRQRLRQNLPVEIRYDHPLLKEVLAETLGVILYQEQVIGVAMALAGFTAGQADQLRRAMTRKRSHDAMSALRQQFAAGAAAKGVDPATTGIVFEKLLAFAEYGFPKSHAAAFAVLAYQSSYLKHYYPAEFLCALLNNQPMGFYPPHVLINDAKRSRVRILPPDVNQSQATCTVEDGNAVRIGLRFVEELGAAAALRIAAERAVNGPYRSLADLVRRVPVRAEGLENLVAVGAAETFGLSRREALWQIGLFFPARTFGGGHTPKTAGTQLALPLPIAQDMVELPAMRPWEQMATDYDVLGLSPRYHPLGLLRPRLARDLVATNELEHLPDGLRLRIAGLVVCRQRPGTAKGVTFLLLEDEVGLVNVIIYPALYEEHRHVVRGEPFLLIDGTLQHHGATINIVAETILPLDVARTVFPMDTPRLPVSDAIDVDIIVEPAPAAIPTKTLADLRALAPAAHNYR
ncbi:MAG: error-prone DNA polymerase [Chloroflexota bacterium]|nr:error-prone DNA polymerase [Chloroflexota bacterium]